MPEDTRSSRPSRWTALKNAAAFQSRVTTPRAWRRRSGPGFGRFTPNGTNTQHPGARTRSSSSASFAARVEIGRRHRALMRHAARQFLAGLHAATAAFGADAAMFMHGCVPLALLGAQPAGGGADAEHASHHFVIETCPAGQDATGDVADVGAIEIQADALGQLVHHALRQAGVGAGSAGLGARITFLDAADQGVVDLALDGRVGADHFAGVHGGLLG